MIINVAGYGKMDSISKGFIYSNGQYTEVLPRGWESAYPQAINNNKMIAGYGYSGGTKYFIYSEGNYTVVTMFGDINNNGNMAGSGNDGSTTKGCIFDGVKYMYFLPYGWKNASFSSINDSNIVAGSGTDGNGVAKAFIGIPLTPAEQIQAIISFYDNEIANGTLYGIGKGKAGEKKLTEFKQMLLQAQSFVENQNIAEACLQLKEAYSRVDGISKPSDYVKGSAAPELPAKIDALIKDLGCP